MSSRAQENRAWRGGSFSALCDDILKSGIDCFCKLLQVLKGEKNPNKQEILFFFEQRSKASNRKFLTGPPQQSEGITNASALPSAMLFFLLNSSSSSLMEENQKPGIILSLLSLALPRLTEFPVFHGGNCTKTKDPSWSESLKHVSVPY